MNFLAHSFADEFPPSTAGLFVLPYYFRCSLQVLRLLNFHLPPHGLWNWVCGGLTVQDALLVLIWLGINVSSVTQYVLRAYPKLEGKPRHLTAQQHHWCFDPVHGFLKLHVPVFAENRPSHTCLHVNTSNTLESTARNAAYMYKAVIS